MGNCVETQPTTSRPASKDDRDNLPVKSCGSKDTEDTIPLNRKPYGSPLRRTAP